jgi:hypothetical protein
MQIFKYYLHFLILKKMKTKKPVKLNLLKEFLNPSKFIEAPYFEKKEILTKKYNSINGYILAKLALKEIMDHPAYSYVDNLKEEGILEKETVEINDSKKKKGLVKMIAFRIKRTNEIFARLFFYFLDSGEVNFRFFVNSEYFNSCKKIWGEQKKHYRKFFYKKNPYEFMYPIKNKELLRDFLYSEKKFNKRYEKHLINRNEEMIRAIAAKPITTEQIKELHTYIENKIGGKTKK